MRPMRRGPNQWHISTVRCLQPARTRVGGGSPKPHRGLLRGPAHTSEVRRRVVSVTGIQNQPATCACATTKNSQLTGSAGIAPGLDRPRPSPSSGCDIFRDAAPTPTPINVRFLPETQLTREDQDWHPELLYTMSDTHMTHLRPTNHAHISTAVRHGEHYQQVFADHSKDEGLH